MNYVNGTIYFMLGLLGPLQVYLSTDDAAKYIDPTIRFWLIAVIGSFQGGFGAVKAYLSLRTPKNGNGNGHLIPTVPKTP